MNKLLSIVCVCGVWAATSMSCMDDTVVDADMSQIDDWGISHFDGTIYEYLEQGDKSLGVTFDSLRYLLDYDDPNTQRPLKLKDLKACLQDEQGEYTLLAMPDSCFRTALKQLNLYRKINQLTDANGELNLEEILAYHKEIEREPEKKGDPAITDIYEYKQVLDTLTCRYVLPGSYDMETLYASGRGLTVMGMYYNYRMRLEAQRRPASGFVGVGTKKLYYYDMCDTQQSDKWVAAQAIWTDVYCKNGVVHVLTPEHEFGYGIFTHYLKNLGNEQ